MIPFWKCRKYWLGFNRDYSENQSHANSTMRLVDVVTLWNKNWLLKKNRFKSKLERTQRNETKRRKFVSVHLEENCCVDNSCNQTWKFPCMNAMPLVVISKGSLGSSALIASAFKPAVRASDCVRERGGGRGRVLGEGGEIKCYN